MKCLPLPFPFRKGSSVTYACNNKFKMDIEDILSYIVGRELMSIISDNRLEERVSISGRGKGFFL
jgi:hypothetical protein